MFLNNKVLGPLKHKFMEKREEKKVTKSLGTSKFEAKIPLIQKWAFRVVLPLGIVSFVLGCFIGWGIITGILLIGLSVAVQCLWVVPTGNIGYVEVFQKVKDKTYQPGLNWFIPIITDRYLMDTRVQEFARDDTKKIVLGTNIDFRETFNYRLKKEYVHVVFSTMGPDYWETVMEWIDNSIDNITSKFSYAEIRANQEGFKEMLLKGVQTTVEKKCRELTASLYPTSSIVEVYELENVFETIEDPDNPGNFISVPKKMEIEEDGVQESVMIKEMARKEVALCGINFFDLMTLTINDIQYPKEYQEARNKLVNERVNVAVAKETANKIGILAEAKKNAKILEAEAEAEAIKKKGEAENGVITGRGEALGQHPIVIQETIAKNYPKVVGTGVMPTLSVEDILPKKKDEDDD